MARECPVCEHIDEGHAATCENCGHRYADRRAAESHREASNNKAIMLAANSVIVLCVLVMIVYPWTQQESKPKEIRPAPIEMRETYAKQETLCFDDDVMEAGVAAVNKNDAETITALVRRDKAFLIRRDDRVKVISEVQRPLVNVRVLTGPSAGQRCVTSLNQLK